MQRTDTTAHTPIPREAGTGAPPPANDLDGFPPRLDHALASPYIRVLASIVDVGVLFAANLLLVLANALMGSEDDTWARWASRAIGVAYLVLGWGIGGQTVGKRLVGIRVVCADGRRPSLLLGVKRFVGYVVACIPFHLGLLPILWHPRRQGWHDAIAGSVVVDLSRPAAPAEAPSTSPPGDHPAFPQSAPSVSSLLTAVACYLVVALLFLRPLAGHLMTHRVGGPGHDGSLFLWALWYVGEGRFLDPDPALLSTKLFFWPQGVSLLYQTMVWADGLVSMPLQRLLPLIAVYNVVLVGSLVLSCTGAFYVARRFVSDGIAAWVGGLAFGLSPYFIQQAHLGHLNQVSLAVMPWAALAAWRMPQRRWLGAAVAAGLLVAVAGYVDYYVLTFTGVAVAAVAVVGCLSVGLRLRTLLARAAVALAVATVALLPLLVPAAAQFGDTIDQPLGWREGASMDWGAFLLPNQLGYASRLRALQMPELCREGAMAMGPVLLLLAGLGAATARRAALPWLWLAAVGILLATGQSAKLFSVDQFPAVPVLLLGGPPGNGMSWPHDTDLSYDLAQVLVDGRGLMATTAPLPSLPYQLACSYGPVACMAAPGRFVAVSLLGIAVLAALGVSRVVNTLRLRGHAGPWSALVGLIVLAELLPLPAHLSPRQDHPFYHTLRADSNLYALIDVPLNPYSRDYLEFQTSHCKPIAVAVHSRPPADVDAFISGNPLLQALSPDGISERGPTELMLAQAGISQAEFSSSLQQLRETQFRYVLVHVEMLEPASLLRLRSDFEGQPGLHCVHSDAELEVWEIR